jgi:hypothetical protein
MPDNAGAFHSSPLSEGAAASRRTTRRRPASPKHHDLLSARGQAHDLTHQNVSGHEPARRGFYRQRRVDRVDLQRPTTALDIAALLRLDHKMVPNLEGSDRRREPARTRNLNMNRRRLHPDKGGDTKKTPPTDARDAPLLRSSAQHRADPGDRAAVHARLGRAVRLTWELRTTRRQPRTNAPAPAASTPPPQLSAGPPFEPRSSTTTTLAGGQDKCQPLRRLIETKARARPL